MILIIEAGLQQDWPVADIISAIKQRMEAHSHSIAITLVMNQLNLEIPDALYITAAICDISLNPPSLTQKLLQSDRIVTWEESHPGWRFLILLSIIKGKVQSLSHVDSDRILTLLDSVVEEMDWQIDLDFAPPPIENKDGSGHGTAGLKDMEDIHLYLNLHQKEASQLRKYYPRVFSMPALHMELLTQKIPMYHCFPNNNDRSIIPFHGAAIEAIGQDQFFAGLSNCILYPLVFFNQVLKGDELSCPRHHTPIEKGRHCSDSCDYIQILEALFSTTTEKIISFSKKNRGLLKQEER